MTWPDPTIQPSGGWSFSSEHPTSSHDIPVLVSPGGDVFGPGDPLSVAQVAELRGTSSSYVRAAIRRGYLPSTTGIKGAQMFVAILARDAVKPGGRVTSGRSLAGG